MAKHILIIDDDANICKFLSESLKLKGYRTSCYAAAEPALESLAEQDYDLALVDIMLPGMSGIDFCRQLRDCDPAQPLPVVLMTAFSREAEQLQGCQDQLAVNDCLFKPFTLTQLHQLVAQRLGVPGETEPAQLMQLQGKLEDTSFPQLLHNLYILKSTGLLQVERGSLKKVVYVKEGYPIFARSNLVRECLGQMLVEDGVISAEQCDESLRRVKEGGRLQGTVLIEMELLTPHQLHEVLHQQVTEKLLEIFSWTEGDYKFIQGSDFKKGVTSIRLSPAALIYQGIRRHYTSARLTKLLAPSRHRYLAQSEHPHYRFQDIGFANRDQKVFALCRGDLTLAEILERFPLAKMETEQLLAALLVSEMVEGHDAPISSGETADDHPPLSADASKLREELLEDYQRLIGLDYFKLLGVDANQSKAQMRKAYFALAKRYHPDQFLQQNLPDELKHKLSQLFQRIGEAYETLSNPSRLKAYQERLKGETGEKPKIEDVLKAETAFQKGRFLLRARNYAEAFKQLSICFELSPEEPEYLTHYAWALSRNQPGNAAIQETAKQHLLHSVHLNSSLDLSHLYLGYLLKDEGKQREAEKRFELAIQCNPNCTEALRELRLSNLRKEKDKKPRSLLDKMFRKDR